MSKIEMLPTQLSVWHYLVRQAGDNKNNGEKSDMETTPYQRPHKGHFHTCEHDGAPFSPVRTHIKKGEGHTQTLKVTCFGTLCLGGM